jgi:ArsR family transcriptional regulator
MYFDPVKTEAATGVFKAIAHPLRLKIVEYLDKKPNAFVNEIYKALNLEQSITSQHLKILKSANLVFAKRNGKYIEYSLNYELISHIVALNTSFAK